LRRAWSADPAIRNFREIAENQYDFATGADLPGFGDLGASADELRKMVADVFGGQTPPIEETAKIPEKPARAEAAAPTQPGDAQETAAGSEAQEIAEGTLGEPEKDVVQCSKVDTAMQQGNTEVEYAAAPTRRPHGRALPQ